MQSHAVAAGLPQANIEAYSIMHGGSVEHGSKFEWLAIVVSFAMLLAGPSIAGERGTFIALVLAGGLCIWRTMPMLFLFIASAGAYFPNPEFSGIGLTPTRLVAVMLLVRCLISPGPAGLITAFQRQSAIALAFAAALFVGLGLGAIVGIVRDNLSFLILAVTTCATYVFLVALISQVGTRAKLVMAISVGLLVPVAYYPLVWAGLLAPIRELGAGTGTGVALRVAAGHSGLNFIGHLIAPLMGLGVLSFLVARGHIIRYVGLGVALLALAAAFNTGSRASVLAGGLGVAIALIAAVRIHGFAGLGSSVYLAIVLPIAMLLIWGYVSDSFTMLQDRFQHAQQSQRIPLWLFAFDHILSHPIPDYQLFANTAPVRTAHSTYLEAGALGGWLGLIGMVGLGVYALSSAVRGFQSARGQAKAWASGILILACCVFCSIAFNAVISHKLAWTMIVALGFRKGFWDASEEMARMRQFNVSR